MKILAVADIESKSLWDYYTPDKLSGVELMISCGDLSPKYLEFLVTMGNCPFSMSAATTTVYMTQNRRKAVYVLKI